MKSFTKEERRALAWRIFEALCEHYPDRYIALAEQPGNIGLTADGAQSASEISDLIVIREPNLWKRGAVNGRSLLKTGKID